MDKDLIPWIRNHTPAKKECIHLQVHSNFYKIRILNIIFIFDHLH